MEPSPQTNFVDRLLAHLDGEIAPIWITQLITLNEAVKENLLKQATRDLITETDRLQMIWNPRRGRWHWSPSFLKNMSKVMRINTEGDSHSQIVNSLMGERVDLTHDIPLRITMTRLTDKVPDQWLLSLQLHHAVGDAKSLLYLTDRFLQHLSGKADPEKKLENPFINDRTALQYAVRGGTSLLYLLSSKYRVLSKRGYCLKQEGVTPGSPLLYSLRIPLTEEYLNNASARSNLFFSAILAGILGTEKQSSTFGSSPIRLRVPVDLRKSMGIGRTLENACSALAIEISPKQMKNRPKREFGSLVQKEITKQIHKGVHWATLLECLAISRLAGRPSFKKVTQREYSAKTRAATLVTTYIGSVDTYYQNAPFQIRTLRSHTPTWGVNGYTFQNALHINLSAFSGIWEKDTLHKFGHSMLEWLEAEHRLVGEVVG